MDAIQVHVLVFEYRTMNNTCMILVKLRKKKGQQEETEEKRGGGMAIARFCLINGKVS